MTYVTAKIPIEIAILKELDGTNIYLASCPLLNNINATGTDTPEAMREIKAKIDAYFEV